MNLALCPSLKFRAFYPGTNSPLVGGLVYTVLPGTTVMFGIAPQFPMFTYADSAGLAMNSNPIVLDGNGEADVWLSGYTKFVVYDKDGNLIETVDNVSSTPGTILSTGNPIQFQSIVGAPTFIDLYNFSLLGNLAATFPVGIQVAATIASGTIYGIVQAVSVGGSPQATTVTVTWYNTVLDASVLAIAVGILTPQGLGSAIPAIPTIPISASQAFTVLDMFKTIDILASITGDITLTLPLPTAVPANSWIRFRNRYLGMTYKVRFSGVVNGMTNPYMLGLWWELWSDGTVWWATQMDVLDMGLALSLYNAGNNGTATVPTVVDLSAIIPPAARTVTGILSTNVSAKFVYLSNDAAGGNVIAVNVNVATPALAAPFVRYPLLTPQSLWYWVDSGGSAFITITGYSL